MCMSCGCGTPNDAHGDKRNITVDDMNNAAQAAGITPQQAAQNIADASQNMGMKGMGGQMGQSQGRGYNQGQSGYQAKGNDPNMGRRGYGDTPSDFDRL